MLKRLPLLLLLAFPPLALAAAEDPCESQPPGDWREGTETREEAQGRVNDELAESLEKYHECLQAIMAGGEGSAGSGGDGAGPASPGQGGAGAASAGQASVPA